MPRAEAKQTLVLVLCSSGKSIFVLGAKRIKPNRGMALRADLTCC